MTMFVGWLVVPVFSEYSGVWAITEARYRRPTGELPVRTITPAKAASLCGKSLDWIEAIAP